MNTKLNNTCIKCESVEHGAEIVKFYEANGYDTDWSVGNAIDRYYGVFNGDFDFYNRPKGAKVLTLQEAKDLVKENQYPKVMWVKDKTDTSWFKRVVFAEKLGMYFAWSDAETIEDAERETDTHFYEYAKDIEDESELQTKTLERIAAIEKELEELKKLIK